MKIKKHLALTVSLLALVGAGIYFWDDGHQDNAQTSKNHGKTMVTIEDQTVTVRFGPIDLPSSYNEKFGPADQKIANKLGHFFELPEDMYLVGYKAAVFTKDGAPLPQKYLHHLILMNQDKKNLHCPSQINRFMVAASGVEMTEVRFPEGYGVKLGKGETLWTTVMFDHMVPPTKDAMASLTLKMAPVGATVQPMEAIWAGVSRDFTGCVKYFGKKGKDETHHGIPIKPGLDVRSASLKFGMDGCVKYAYPHGHDQLLLLTLENKTTGQTLLRTVPKTSPDGALLAFLPHQVYKDPVGFSINTKDEYGMTMVYHRPLNDLRHHFGMGNYLMYMTPGPC